METRNCKNCNQSFNIEIEDFAFYDKIKVPPPTLCPNCRQQRRYAWRNERTLYKRNCDLCAKSIVTIYSPNKPHKVYCLSCWWSDGWDPAAYGRDFDFSRPFFEQFAELQKEVPRIPLLTKNSVNSDYCNHSGDNKNAYVCFSCFGNEDISYCTWVMNSRNCTDCSYIYEKGERLYECIDSRLSYQCQYCILVKGCSDCYYCYDCSGCSDCFLSTNLRNKRYVFNNIQYTKEEYREKVAEFKLGSSIDRLRLFEQFMNKLRYSAIHKYMVGEQNVMSKGNMICGCKNAFMVFDGDQYEDCRYIYGSLDIKDSMDVYHAGIKTELCYESHGCTRIYNTQFCHLCYDNSHLMYCDSCQNSQNLFGCISIKKGEYMIFNKKYSKEDYYTLKSKIIDHMKTTGEYGEFFPPSIAPVYYNETRGQIYMPMTKEEVLHRGWNWEEKVPGIFGKGTIEMKDIPDNIKDVEDSFLSNILTCIACSKNYNVTQDELEFYKRETLPLPRKCPDCREKVRISLRLPRNLWHRQCTCNLPNHEHEGTTCLNEFDTAYAPDRPEKVYCERCYQQEVL